MKSDGDKKKRKGSRSLKKSFVDKRLLLGFLFGAISLASLIFFACFIFSLDILPIKMIIIGATIIAIVYILLFIGLFKQYKNKGLRIFVYILSFVISVGFVVASIIYLRNTDRFLNSVAVEDYETVTFSVISLKNSDYDDIDDLHRDTIGIIDDLNTSNAQSELSEKIDFDSIKEENAYQLAQLLFNNEVPAICLEQGYIALLNEVIDNFESDTRVIYSFDIKVESIADLSDVNPITEPFIVYISGIDQYGEIQNARGRSDVNQLMIINPTSHEMLIVNTPRDYYVQLAGTTGLKDKLTHAGIYGIETSIETLDDLYGINIDYYIRINFDSLINLVDLIDGIDVYSDTDFTPLHAPDTHVIVGMNHFDGVAALGYSRERFAYASGDRHRGENQQDVIEAIFKKVTESSSLLGNYSQIMGVMSGSFETNIPKAYISGFIKSQLDDMAKWDVETYSVDGAGSMEPTYSMGANLPLYVMIPDETTVNTAKQKINEVLSS